MTFNSIKAYLTKPSILARPDKGKPLVLYVIVLEHSLNALLPQENTVEKEHTLRAHSNARRSRGANTPP